jgi:hypothetical protein
LSNVTADEGGCQDRAPKKENQDETHIDLWSVVESPILSKRKKIGMVVRRKTLQRQSLLLARGKGKGRAQGRCGPDRGDDFLMSSWAVKP